MKSRVLNAWSGKRRNSDGTEVSAVSIESTAAPSHIDVQGPFPAHGGDHTTKVALAGLGLTMAEDEILIADGLTRKFRVLRGPDNESVLVEIQSEFSSSASISLTQGMPYLTSILFSRKPLVDLMKGRKIAVDPGHGGKDHGFRGPVNLLEKDCALDVAKELEALLADAGAVPLMTRDSDRFLAPGLRLAGMPASTEMAVEIHVSAEKDPLARSYHCFCRRGCAESHTLAKSVSAALNERMGTPFPDPEEMSVEGNPDFPVIRVEPVCLTYFADEANFRAPLYRKRIAQGVFNGIARYLRGKPGGD